MTSRAGLHCQLVELKPCDEQMPPPQMHHPVAAEEVRR